MKEEEVFGLGDDHDFGCDGYDFDDYDFDGLTLDEDEDLDYGGGENSVAEISGVAEESDAKPDAPLTGKAKVQAKAKARTKTLGRKGRKPMEPCERVVNNIRRKAELDAEGAEIPTLDHLVRGETSLERVKLADLAIFISEPEDEALAKIAADLPLRNRVNLSACVDLKRVQVVGGQVLSQGRLFQPLQAARIEGEGTLELTSGRHRAVFLALMYGTDIEVPVYIEDMTLSEARDAVVVANMARKAKAMEQAEHAALQSVGGDISAELEDFYLGMAKNKKDMKNYCVFGVVNRGQPAKLDFSVSNNSSRKDGSLATINGMKSFWGGSLEWHRGMSFEDFNKGLCDATDFLNRLVAEFKKSEDFNPEQQMANMTLQAIGRYYRVLADAGADINDRVVADLARIVLGLGGIGRQNANDTYVAIVAARKSG
jgi:hypothetical protein